MLNTRKRIIISISFLAAIFISLIGFSYAYYTANITGNTSDNPSLSLKSGYLAITYTDGTSSITGGSSGTTTDDLEYTKNFTITNDGVADAYYGVWINNYKVTTSTGNYTSFVRPEDWTYILKSGDTIIKTGTLPTSNEAIITAMPLSVGESQELTLVVTYNYITEEEGGTDQSADQNKSLTFDVNVTQSLDNLESAKEGTLLYAINRDNEITTLTTDNTIPGQAPSLETEAILTSTEDDYGESYYFRGNVKNNYVTYANMCWRIVRVQGDGTIKLILADRDNGCKTEEGYDATDGQSAFIADPNTQGFAYKYHGADDDSDLIYENSDISKTLNAWVNGGSYKYIDISDTWKEIDGTFAQKISDTNQQKLVITEWCNDTSITSKTFRDKDHNEIYETDENFDELLEYTSNVYGAYERLSNATTANPSLKCNFKGIDNTKAVRYKGNIGILTADEVAFAGGTANAGNNSYFLYTNANIEFFWTMSPSGFKLENFSDGALVWGVYNNTPTYPTYLEYYLGVFNEGAHVRPSVVLKRDVKVTTESDTTTYGEPGTQNNPYVIID